MKRFFLLASLAALVTGCANKREICAEWATMDIPRRNTDSISASYKKKLGIKNNIGRGWDAAGAIDGYCEFYK